MNGEINPAIGSMLKSARDWLTHEHSLFRSLNLEPVLIGKGRATFAVDLPADFADTDGAVHGGLMTIIMDSIFGLAVFTALEQLKPIATINLRTDYLASADTGTRVVCTSQCNDIHGDVAYVSGNIKTHSDNKLLATGSGTFMIGTRSPSKGSRL